MKFAGGTNSAAEAIATLASSLPTIVKSFKAVREVKARLLYLDCCQSHYATFQSHPDDNGKLMSLISENRPEGE